MNDITFDQRYSRQPARIVQTAEQQQVDLLKGWYEIEWTAANDLFGIFRIQPLKANVATNKQGVINILKAAYKEYSIKSFEDAVKFAEVMGVRIIHDQYKKGQSVRTYATKK